MKTKTNTLLITLFMSIINIYAKNDTLFYENFDAWGQMEIIDSIFGNLDEDGLTAANGLPNNWFVAPLSNGGADSLEVAAISASWLDGYLHGNRNWLTLPPINLGDSAATLSWRSAPATGDLYLDGYTVVISTDETYFNSIFYSDTLMHFAQNMNDNVNDFSNGTRHSNLDYNAPIALTNTVQYPGLFSPWSVDLSAYKEQKVYISFLHDSDDDNYIAIDDIVVTGKEGTVINPGTWINDKDKGHGIRVWPRLVVNTVNLSFNVDHDSNAIICLYNMFGQLVKKYHQANDGKHLVMDFTDIKAGAYFISVDNNETHFTTKIIKQ